MKHNYTLKHNNIYIIHLADASIQSDLQLRKTAIYHKMARNTRSAI